MPIQPLGAFDLHVDRVERKLGMGFEKSPGNELTQDARVETPVLHQEVHVGQEIAGAIDGVDVVVSGRGAQCQP